MTKCHVNLFVYNNNNNNNNTWTLFTLCMSIFLADFAMDLLRIDVQPLIKGFNLSGYWSWNGRSTDVLLLQPRRKRERRREEQRLRVWLSVRRRRPRLLTLALQLLLLLLLLTTTTTTTRSRAVYHQHRLSLSLSVLWHRLVCPSVSLSVFVSFGETSNAASFYHASALLCCSAAVTCFNYMHCVQCGVSLFH